MKANWVSICVKILGALIILAATILIGCGLWNISMTDVVTGVLAMQAMVLSIDISKIKVAH